MTIPTMVAKPSTAAPRAALPICFVKLPSFLAIFLFPSLFAAIGQANATLFVAIFPLIGLWLDLHPAGGLWLRARLRQTALRTAAAGGSAYVTGAAMTAGGMQVTVRMLP